MIPGCFKKFVFANAGEITCGYADGGFTQEQTLLVAYHRGRMCRDHGITGGLMAAVGLGAAEAEKRLAAAGAAGCVVACDNSPTSTTLSGEFWFVNGLSSGGLIGLMDLCVITIDQLVQVTVNIAQHLPSKSDLPVTCYIADQC